MPLLDRESLKNFFQAGRMPSQSNFEDLIDSSMNKVDDGFSKSEGQGLQLAPENSTGGLLSLYESTTAIQSQQPPAWTFTLQKDGSGQALAMVNPRNQLTGFYLQPGGNVGLGTLTPQAKLEVAGDVLSTGRKGSYTDQKINPATVLADGKWHPIITGLDGLHGFEVVASASGPKGQGKYALIHAIALSTYGNSKSAINYTSARYKGWCLKLQLRWTGTTNSYNLEIRTRKNFGTNVPIKYAITQIYSEI